MYLIVLYCFTAGACLLIAYLDSASVNRVLYSILRCNCQTLRACVEWNASGGSENYLRELLDRARLCRWVACVATLAITFLISLPLWDEPRESWVFRGYVVLVMGVVGASVIRASSRGTKVMTDLKTHSASVAALQEEAASAERPHSAPQEEEAAVSPADQGAGRFVAGLSSLSDRLAAR